MEARMKQKKSGILLLIICWSAGGVALAEGPDLGALLKSLAGIPSVTGSEERLAMEIKNKLPGSLDVETDNLGSVYAVAGKGDSRIVVGAPLDEFGWFVSGITADGYLRLDRAVPAPHPAFDSFLMGHAVVIASKGGLQNGVISQPSMHLLTSQRREELANDFSLDFVYLDIGARSEEEVKARGVEYLDSVSFRPVLSKLAGDQWAGPSLSQKAVCAALTRAAIAVGEAKMRAAAHFVWMVQTRFLGRGSGGRTSLGATRARNRLEPKTVLLLDTVAADIGDNSPLIGKGPVLWQTKDGPSRLRDTIEAAAKKRRIGLQNLPAGESPLMRPFLGNGNDVLTLALPVKYSRTPSEIINLRDVRAIADLVEAVVEKGDWQ
jgi:putative aminopeptidase FrvX